MNILITETNEIRTLSIDEDPTDSILSNYTHNEDFQVIDESRDNYNGGAEFEMSQEAFDWWAGTCEACNELVEA